MGAALGNTEGAALAKAGQREAGAGLSSLAGPASPCWSQDLGLVLRSKAPCWPLTRVWVGAAASAEGGGVLPGSAHSSAESVLLPVRGGTRAFAEECRSLPTVPKG